MKYDSYLHLLTCWEQKKKKDEQTAAERNKKVGSISHKTFQVWAANVYVTKNTEVKAKDSGKVSNDLSCASGLLVTLIGKAHEKCCKLVMSIPDFDTNCLAP